jgi:phage terminase Nu1 subunit (DNA packaging protein)
MGEKITRAELGRRLGVTRQAVQKYVASGIIILENGKLDYEDSLAALEMVEAPERKTKRKIPKKKAAKKPPKKTARSVSKPPEPEKRQPTYGEAKTMRELYAARMAKLKYEEAKKTLVPAKQVTDQAFESARLVRDALLAIPSRMRERLAAEDSPAKIYGLLVAEIESALAELAK